MSRHEDTIAALATPGGTAAIAMLRITGSDTERIVTGIAGTLPAARKARHLDYRSTAGEVLDDVVLTFFRGPASYTGEDSAEITCHGSPFIVQKILEDLFARGCRPAQPGEFTQRAFLNGRMDLSQAEAVMDLIHARSERALAAAHQQLRGGLSRRMEPLVAQLLAVVAEIEAYIDFPEEDLPAENLEKTLSAINHITLETNKLSASSRYGAILRDGIKTVIVGAPNAGKSSLLNRLVGLERALVSAEPGTTRDFIEERLVVGPHLMRLIDTAGLNPSPAPLERLGMAKTLERVEEADLLLVVVDGSRPPPPLPAALVEKLLPSSTLVLLNKADLVRERAPAALLPGRTQIWVSALSGEGIDALTAAIVAKADAFAEDPADLVTVSMRHGHALAQARDLLTSAAAKLAARDPVELVASDLRGVLDAFGQITGRIDNERVLDALFATFCIGK